MTTKPAELTSPAAPEPDLTPEQVIARAEKIAPTLVERQAETEQRTFYAEDTHEEFVRAGFYRILVPRRYGGYEFGTDTFMRVAMTLARGCPSTGWMYLFGAAHALPVATLFPEPTQAELFGSGHFICPATVALSGTAERVDGGDWIINGSWPYSSGAPYATHFLGHALVPAGDDELTPMLFVAPRELWRREENWGDQLGLRGSGSHAITIERGRLSERFTLPLHLSQPGIADTAPGRALHGNPMYGGGPLSFMLLELGALAIGMARGALDCYEEQMRRRMTIFPPIVPRYQDPDYQFRYGEASGMIATAEAAFWHAIEQWGATCELGPGAFTRDQELRLAMISREVFRLCWGAVQGQLFPTAGSSAIRQGERLERVWRDMSMMHSHAGLGVFLASLANREFARLRFDVR